MPITDHGLRFELLSSGGLGQWRDIPPAIASDCMNRGQAMSGAIKPIARGTTLCGQARTVQCMVGDNSAIHAAVRMARPGEVLVIDAGGYANTALWGGLLTQGALAQGLAGVVIDGAVRDVAEIRELGFPCYTAAIVPAGPHKGHGGTIDAPIACGGCPVSPGDIIVGDDDGIAVVPLRLQAQILEASREKIAQERSAVDRVRAGETLADQKGIPQPETPD